MQYFDYSHCKIGKINLGIHLRISLRKSLAVVSFIPRFLVLWVERYRSNPLPPITNSRGLIKAWKVIVTHHTINKAIIMSSAMRSDECHNAVGCDQCLRSISHAWSVRRVRGARILIEVFFAFSLFPFIFLMFHILFLLFPRHYVYINVVGRPGQTWAVRLNRNKRLLVEIVAPSPKGCN